MTIISYASSNPTQTPIFTWYLHPQLIDVTLKFTGFMLRWWLEVDERVNKDFLSWEYAIW